MSKELERFSHIDEFDNVLVADENGTVIYYDIADLAIVADIGLRPEDFIGNKVTSFYTNLTDENSTIMNVLRSGQPILHHEQQMKTKVGSIIYSISSTYPIFEQERIIGAIEFSKHVYTKENIHLLNQLASHPIYRKNHTIYTIDDIQTSNEKMLQIKNQIRRVALTSSPILIYGKTGTGKDVVAQAIHNASERFARPFVTINCAALPENGLEAELFGTVEGYATNTSERPGLFEQANGGSVFLDKIEELPVRFQSKLLAVIEEKKVRRLGSTTDIFLDFRVISATTELPEKLMENQTLREDLYYRLSVVECHLPQLNERKEDLPLLLHHFMLFYNRHLNQHVRTIDPAILPIFEQYDWPGNIRELKNSVERLFIQSMNDTLSAVDLPKRMLATQKEQISPLSIDLERNNLRDLVEAYEKEIIALQLTNSNGVLAETARRLGLSKQSLKYKLTKYELG